MIIVRAPSSAATEDDGDVHLSLHADWGQMGHLDQFGSPEPVGCLGLKSWVASLRAHRMSCSDSGVLAFAVAEKA